MEEQEGEKEAEDGIGLNRLHGAHLSSTPAARSVDENSVGWLLFPLLNLIAGEGAAVWCSTCHDLSEVGVRLQEERRGRMGRGRLSSTWTFAVGEQRRGQSRWLSSSRL